MHNQEHGRDRGCTPRARNKPPAPPVGVEQENKDGRPDEHGGELDAHGGHQRRPRECRERDLSAASERG